MPPIPQKILALREPCDRARLVRFEQLPNIGKSIAEDFRALGLQRPADLVGRDPYQLYIQRCVSTGIRHDPCLLDCFISVVRFMDGEPARVWWDFTAERKRDYAAKIGNSLAGVREVTPADFGR